MVRLKQAGQLSGIFLFILTLAIFLTIVGTFIYYPIDAQLYQLPQQANMSLSRLMHNYTQLMAFLNFPWVTQLHMADFPSSISGTAHFVDVKKLFILNNVLLVLSALVAMPTLGKWRQQAERWRLYRPFQIGALVPILIGGMAALNFDTFFVTFHKIFFRNSDWLFDPAVDPIINVLPEQFFMHCFIVAFVLFEAAMVWGIWVGKRDLD
ncbi:MAG: TIGR01906 family membrane protein [Lactobacillus sp.]|jgi:integral membrane protein (TIGR01906 family)|nr:TIGR01906 family membrane protein [Lactobacillus sp.]